MNKTLSLSKDGMEMVSSKVEDMMRRIEKVETIAKQKKQPKPSKKTKEEKKKERPLTIQEQKIKIYATFRWLYKNYPKCFFEKKVVPLKIGIAKDILLQLPNAISKRMMRIVLKRYTHSIRYINALIANENRYDLDGEIAGIVTEEEKFKAEEFLKLISEK